MNKLLILDDSTDLLYILQYYFEKKGYTVKTLDNGLDVYSQVMAFEPDLLLIDVFLSGVDGREICKALRDFRGTEKLRILLTSASPANLKDYKGYFADDCIEKPFELHHLEQKIRSMIGLSTSTEVHEDRSHTL